MKILRVIPSMDPEKGGPSEGIRQVQNEIYRQKIDIECDIVCLDKELEPNDKNRLLNINCVGEGKSGYSYSLGLKKWLAENIRNYDLVIIHGLWQYHSIVTSNICFQQNIPYILYTHGMLDPWFKKAYPLKHFKKLVYWMLLERKVVNRAKAVIFTCEEEKLLARESFPLYKPIEKVTAYGTAGSDINKHLAMEKFYNAFPEVANKKIILFVGRIHEKKGCDILLRAFDRIKSKANNYHVFFAGPADSEYAKSLKLETRKLGLDNFVTWGGMLQGEEKWGAYYSSDVFALPSHQENFGIVVAEALSCSLPVIITNKVNIWREIKSFDAGLISEDNISEFEKSLFSFTQLSDDKKNLLRANSKNCFDDNFEISKVAKSFQRIITQLRA